MSAILNLGAGNDIMRNAVNHDLTPHRPEITVVWDLNTLPWPWPDSSFDLVVARAVLEHLRLTLVESLNECWRILRPRGVLFIKLPYWDSDVAHEDPTHRWFFSAKALDQFDPETKRGQQYSFYTPCKWKIVEPLALNKAGSSLLGRLQVRK